MFEVHGYVDAVPYAVTVGKARPEAAATHGVVSGSPVAVGLIAAREGETISRPRMMPVLVDASDAASVLVALREWTQVIKVVGDAPGPADTSVPQLGDQVETSDAITA
ncbi:hypothetical protein [Planomonospora sp. ID82291]|uniref:hypothetical protein n=1 Tax=Planomonospora sp. ID82291 TaxID=2738136 RepID=UPI0018C36054|nr:hypothetical protein [Planomonospora sp. ID82291]MBG0818774.1 hypothetical protein [Planomonospora sp. ID82291]